MSNNISSDNNNNNCGFVLVGLKNNNNYDNVYVAIIMTKVIVRVHPAHLMNADLAPGGRLPSDKPINWAVSLPKIGSYHPHPPSPLLLLLSP